MPAANRLLAGLPREVYERLLSLGVRVPLSRGHVLYARGDPMRFAYFPTSGFVSFLATTEHGQTVEVAMTGNDGPVGLPIILHVDIASHQTVVQIGGEAFASQPTSCGPNAHATRHSRSRCFGLPMPSSISSRSLRGAIVSPPPCPACLDACSWPRITASPRPSSLPMKPSPTGWASHGIASPRRRWRCRMPG